VFVTITPNENSSEEEAAGARGLLVTSDPAVAPVESLVLTFNESNWFLPQTIYVVAATDTANEASQKQVAETFAFSGGTTGSFNLQRNPLALERIEVNGQRIRSTEFTLSGQMVSLNCRPRCRRAPR